MFADFGRLAVRPVAPRELAARAEQLARGEFDAADAERTRNDLRLTAWPRREWGEMHWIGGLLRRMADRIDYAGAPRLTHWSFTWEDGEGLKFRNDGRGCPLWYLGSDQYERAFAEADKPG